MENVHELQHPLLAKNPGKVTLQSELLNRTSHHQEHSRLFSRQGLPDFPWFHQPGSVLANQLLDPGSLQRTVEPYRPSDPALYPERWKTNYPQGWKKKDYIETAFGDSKEAGELPRKVALEKDIHTVCYEVGDTEGMEFEVRGAGMEKRMQENPQGKIHLTENLTLVKCDGGIQTHSAVLRKQ